MNNMLSDLWNGRIAPIEDFHLNEEYHERQRALITAENKLVARLDEAAKALYEELDRCHAELDKIAEELIFQRGFCLAVQLLAAGFSAQ